MPTLKEIKRRKKSIISTQQITRAMKLIAAAKLKRYSGIINEARQYSSYLNGSIERILSSRFSYKHPYFEPEGKGEDVALLFLTSDKGLCGGYNANLVKEIQSFLDIHNDKIIHVIGLGKKGLSFVEKKGLKIKKDIRDWSRINLDLLVQEVSKPLMELYDKGNISKASIIYSKFISTLSQRPTTEQLLPFTKFKVDEEERYSREFIFEPSEKEVFEYIIREYLRNSIHIALLESLASEFGARMSAMDNATRNAEEMLYNLTLTYNKLRQSTITKELIEIVSGSEALKS